VDFYREIQAWLKKENIFENLTPNLFKEIIAYLKPLPKISENHEQS
jgi:hypothetical protein